MHGMNLSLAMTQRYDRVYKEAPELTGDCLRDVLEMGEPTSASQGCAFLACCWPYPTCRIICKLFPGAKPLALFRRCFD